MSSSVRRRSAWFPGFAFPRRAGRSRTKADRWKDWTKTWRKPRTPIRLLRNGYDSDHDVTCIRAILLEWSILVPSFLSLRETGQRRAAVGVIKWRLMLMLRHSCCWLRCTDVWPFGMSDRFLVNDGVGGQLKAKHHRVRTTFCNWETLSYGHFQSLQESRQRTAPYWSLRPPSLI